MIISPATNTVFSTGSVSFEQNVNYIHTQIKPHVNIINCMNIQILIVNIIIIRNMTKTSGWVGKQMGLFEKSGWGLKLFSTGTPCVEATVYAASYVYKTGKWLSSPGLKHFVA